MKIGLLGGIGPEATGHFYTSLIDSMQDEGLIRSNTDYPQIVINSIPARELIFPEDATEDILSDYIKGIRELAEQHPDFIAMLCNTIHLFVEKIKKETGYNNIISLRDLVLSHVTEHHKQDTLCVLGSPITIKNGLYHSDSLSYYDLDDSEIDELGNLIIEFNKNRANKDIHQRFIDLLLHIREKTEKVVFLSACTEISELFSYTEGFRYVDTLDILREEILQRIKKSIG